MINRHKGEIEVALNGDVRVWRLRWKDIAALEDYLSQRRGKRVGWMEIQTSLTDLPIAEFGAILWAGLRHENAELSPEDVMEQADYSLLNRFMVELGQRMSEAMPEAYRKKVEAGTETANPQA